MVDFTAPKCDARLNFRKKKSTLINFMVRFLSGAGGDAKSELPFPLHLRDPFVNQLPQDIRVVMNTLLDSLIRINHNVS